MYIIYYYCLKGEYNLDSKVERVLLEKGFTQYEIDRFKSILDKLSDVYECKFNTLGGRWTPASRRKQSEMAKEFFKRNRDNAEFIIYPREGEQITIIGWDAIIKATGLKEVSLRAMFSLSPDKNLITRDIMLNGEHYQALIEYKSVRKG